MKLRSKLAFRRLITISFFCWLFATILRAQPNNTEQAPLGALNAPLSLSTLILSDNLAEEILPVYNEIFPDANRKSGQYYYLPARYVLKWHPLEKYDLRVLYGADKRITVTATLVPVQPSPADFMIIRNLIQKNVKGTANEVAGVKLVPLPIKNIDINFDLPSYVTVDKSKIQIPSNLTDNIVLTFSTQDITQDIPQLMTILTELPQGLLGDVTVIPSSSHMQDRKIQLKSKIKINTEDIYGRFSLQPVLWRTVGWTNPTDYPVSLSRLDILKENERDTRVYSWSIDNLQVGPGQKVVFNSETVPTSLDNDLGVRKIWLNYNVLRCDSCNRKVKEAMTISIRTNEQPQPVKIEMFALNVMCFTKAKLFRVIAKSKNTTPDLNTEGEIRSPLMSKDSNDPIVLGTLFAKGGQNPPYKFQIEFIMPNGSQQRSTWIESSDPLIVVGESQIKEYIPFFKDYISCE